MTKSAVSSSRCALSKCCWASGGTTSRSSELTRWPRSIAMSIQGSVLLRRGIPEPDLEPAVVDAGAERPPVGEHARQRDLAPVGAHRHVELAVMPSEVDIGAVGEGDIEGEHVFSAHLLDLLRARFIKALGWVALAVDR